MINRAAALLPILSATALFLFPPFSFCRVRQHIFPYITVPQTTLQLIAHIFLFIFRLYSFLTYVIKQFPFSSNHSVESFIPFL